MKITMIHGQNHVGSTCHIGRMLAAQFDAQVTEFFLPRDLNHFCLGCCKCIETEEKCPFYADKRPIMEAVEAADLLIFTTPTYCLRASAPMKSFLDMTFTYWMSHKPRKNMFRKKAVVISTAAGIGTKYAIKDITTALFYWGIPYIRGYGISVQAMGWEQVAEGKKEKIQRDIYSLAKKIQKQNVRVGFKTKFIFSMMRLMIKRYEDTYPDKIYWKENGLLEKKRPWQ